LKGTCNLPRRPWKEKKSAHKKEKGGASRARPQETLVRRGLVLRPSLGSPLAKNVRQGASLEESTQVKSGIAVVTRGFRRGLSRRLGGEAGRAKKIGGFRSQNRKKGVSPLNKGRGETTFAPRQGGGDIIAYLLQGWHSPPDQLGPIC